MNNPLTGGLLFEGHLSQSQLPAKQAQSRIIHQKTQEFLAKGNHINTIEPSSKKYPPSKPCTIHSLL